MHINRRKKIMKEVRKALKDMDYYMELANSGKFTKAEKYEETAETRKMIIEGLVKSKEQLEINVNRLLKETRFLTEVKLQ